ncbi:hypothetical protein M2163_008166 [Streptomyces sp. SAI-135]|uniref:DUF1876 domain-containing protein n=1 Tax=unclassified Streptomyces TaxID=2593676 RepID=UPI002476060F|nr:MULTISPECIES: DUF1876 domain-containing protein [unclassified Streptomyces]MDH6514859.1 hypothetical protein [Streptomyces sp. SAI-090]MDH6621058.1 hypothetical protein [Streptomyces sp. SAI-135]
MSHTLEWTVRLFLFEDEGATKARVVLDTGTTSLTGHGAAHCSPADTDVPEIGDELAAGRALHDLARQLVNTAEGDIEGLGTSATKRETPSAVGWSM